MSSLKNWFNSAISGEEFNEVQYDDLREFVFIDRGAFGEVYSANYVSIRNTVAVKKVFQSYLEKQDVFDAFIKELKLHIKLGDNSRIIKFLGVSKEPDLRPNIDEIVVRLNSMRLEPVYCPPSQMPVNSRSFNALLSSISTGHNPTLIFDENLAVPLKSIDEIPPDYGRDQLVNIEMIAGGGFSTVSSAIWRDGPREEWDEETSQWERAFNTKVAVKLHLYCDKVIRCYGVTFAGSPYDDNYGLVLKYASYGDLRSFINKRSFVGCTELLSIITAWNNRSRDENQFNSADRKVRGLKKRRRAKNTQQLASRLLNFS
ncbi:8746_t:CDS:2, partial [Gigaspora rosea]